MRRRRSVNITLVLVGLAAIAGCSSEPQQRHVYKNRQDCLDDWGGEQACEEVRDRSSAYYGRGYYYGPHFSGPLSGGRGSRAISSMSVSRGGFGALSRFHASFGG